MRLPLPPGVTTPPCGLDQCQEYGRRRERGGRTEQPSRPRDHPPPVGTHTDDPQRYPRPRPTRARLVRAAAARGSCRVPARAAASLPPTGLGARRRRACSSGVAGATPPVSGAAPSVQPPVAALAPLGAAPPNAPPYHPARTPHRPAGAHPERAGAGAVAV